MFLSNLANSQELTDEQIERFLIKYALPWYFSFYASWKQAEATDIFVTYESLIKEKYNTVLKILKKLEIEPSKERVVEAINNTEKLDTRKNVGIAGRGRELANTYKKEVAELMNCYPMIDFSGLLG